MTEEKQEGQKTVVAFVAGLLIGGLLVWVFSDTSQGAKDDHDDRSHDDEVAEVVDEGGMVDDSALDDSSSEVVTEPELPELVVGDGAVVIGDTTSGRFIDLQSVTFPTDEGWIGVRGYANDQLGALLGVVRYSKEQGLVPEVIELQVPTQAGRNYAVVFYSENGDRVFSLADDVQIDKIFATFTAK